MNKEEAIKELRDFVAEITKSEDVSTTSEMEAETALTGEDISFSDPEAAMEDDDLRMQGTGHMDTEEEGNESEGQPQEIANEVQEQGSFWQGFFGRA